MITITPKGQLEIDRLTDPGRDPRSAVLKLLYEVPQGLEIEDIMAETEMTQAKTEMIVRTLINEGVAKEVLRDTDNSKG
jgi:hypothetical protein